MTKIRFGLPALIFAGLIFAGLSFGAAHAQEHMVDATIVYVCVLQAGKGDTDPDCIGVAAGACQTATPSGSTTVGISECLMSENAVWDRLLNQEYQANRDAFADTPGMNEKLQTAQRAWIALREADCQIAYDRYGGGSMRTIASAACQMEHTARRALQLRDMREY